MEDIASDATAVRLGEQLRAPHGVAAMVGTECGERSSGITAQLKCCMFEDEVVFRSFGPCEGGVGAIAFYRDIANTENTGNDRQHSS